jgi:hypothetical protein
MSKSSLYTIKVVEETINNYHKRGGEVIEVAEGSLGYGTTICFGEGLKTTIIQEVYLNSWSSGHTIVSYNKCPKKYELMLKNWEARQELEEN